MGLLTRTGNDAFFSYAHDDSADDYVTDIHERLTEHLKAEHRKACPSSTDSPKAALFIDHKGLACNGILDEELQLEIGRSEFLFIFLGDAYKKSEWCESEFAWFEKRFRGKRSQMMEHTFIIVLDEDAEAWWDARRKNKKDQLIRIPFYGISGRVNCRLDKKGKSVNNPTFEKLIQKIAELMVRRQGIVDEPPPPPEPPESKIAFGAVTPDLEPAVDALCASLQAELPELAVQRLTVADLQECLLNGRQALDQKLAGTALVMLLHSDASVELRGARSGGHLAYQAELTDNRIPTRTWRLEGEGGVILHEASAVGGEVAGSETEPAHLDYLQGLADTDGAANGSLGELTIWLVDKFKGPIPSDIPILYIESSNCSERDKKITRQLRARIEEEWQIETNHRVDLRCHPLPWKYIGESGTNAFDDCIGVVLILGEKTVPTLRAQVGKIERANTRLGNQITRAVAAVRPHSEYDGGDLFWDTLVGEFDKNSGDCTFDDKEIEQLVRRLHAHIARDPSRAV